MITIIIITMLIIIIIIIIIEGKGHSRALALPHDLVGRRQPIITACRAEAAS